MRHVYFHTLPEGAEFTHKDRAYLKVDDEKVKDVETGVDYVFESHYGAIIPEEKFDSFGLTDTGIRSDV